MRAHVVLHLLNKLLKRDDLRCLLTLMLDPSLFFFGVKVDES